MSDEIGLEHEDERKAQRAEELGRDERAKDVAGEQVGVGTAPGGPPATGTGPRSQRLSDPPTGRLDEARSSQGTTQRPTEALPKNQPVGAGDEPTDGPAARGDAGVDESGADQAGSR